MSVDWIGGAAGRVLAGAAVVFALNAVAFLSYVQAAPDPGAVAVGTAAAAFAPQSYSWKEMAIQRAFRDVLDREPSRSELREYRDRIDNDGWTEGDIRSDLRSRDRSNRSSSGGRSRYTSSSEVERIIRRAYQDILKRDPDPEGLRSYRHQMMDKGMAEQELRRSLRRSSERSEVKEQDANRIVRRAYQDILGRDPDHDGLIGYRNHILDDRWTERQVRDALMTSREYRQRNQMTRGKAEDIVKRAYRDALGREADPGGLEGYVQKILRDKWTEADVTRALRQSEEYRNKR